jgi:hypothetical protein
MSSFFHTIVLPRGASATGGSKAIPRMVIVTDFGDAAVAAPASFGD